MARVNCKEEFKKYNAKEIVEATERVNTWWTNKKTHRGYGHKTAILCELKYPGSTAGLNPWKLIKK